MGKLVAIGEALIDFIPMQTGCAIKDVVEFKPVSGGAPANVCGAFAKLGGTSQMITQLGDDPFGDKIIGDLEQFHIGTDYIKRTQTANTCLAFVSLMEDGNREFSFYRNPSADMLLEPECVKEEWFKDCDIFHFCSVCLGEYPMKEAHKKAIEYAKANGAIISFDPNLRLPLWRDHAALKKAVLEFMPFADILKISDEELEFITGCSKIEDALDFLFTGDVQMVIYTKGSDGAECYTKKAQAESEAFRVKAVDTTGAGDAFIGSFLSNLDFDGVTKATVADVTAEQMKRYLDFSNKYCSLSVQKSGAIASYPTRDEMKGLL